MGIVFIIHDSISLISEYLTGNLIVTISILILTTWIYLYFSKPINIIRDFTIIDDYLAQKNRNTNYPNGWIGVCESHHLTDHAIKRVDFCGHRVILIRSSSTKKPHALNAFCPHLGADLSISGRIYNSRDFDCIRCPFHGWLFRTDDGLCIDVPYTKDRKPPNGVKIRTWECLEVNGNIYIWYHSEGHKSTWKPTEVEQIRSKEWHYMGRSEHILNCLIQEIPENGADLAHLNVLHAPSFLVGKELDQKLLSNIMVHVWESCWQKGEAENVHKAFFEVHMHAKLFGHKVFVADIDNGEQIGPTIVHLPFIAKVFGLVYRGIYIQNVIPINHNKQRIVHNLYMESSLTSWIACHFILRNEALMIERDIQIWRSKLYLKHPKLVKEDKQILIFRRWYSQFFRPSPESFKFEDLW